MEKPKALTADVGLIRVVVRREAPSNHADWNPPPRSASAKRSHYVRFNRARYERRLKAMARAVGCSEARAGPFTKDAALFTYCFVRCSHSRSIVRQSSPKNLYSDSKSSIDTFPARNCANCLSNASRVLFINESIFFSLFSISR